MPNNIIGETFTTPPSGGENILARFDFAKLSIGRNPNDFKGLGKIVKSYLTDSHRIEHQKGKPKEYPLRRPIP
jgi:hypothetical protein